MITSIVNFLLVIIFAALFLYRFMYETEFEWHVKNMEEDFQNFLAKHLFSKIELKEYKKAKDKIKYQERETKFVKQFGNDSDW